MISGKVENITECINHSKQISGKQENFSSKSTNKLG